MASSAAPDDTSSSAPAATVTSPLLRRSMRPPLTKGKALLSALSCARLLQTPRASSVMPLATVVCSVKPVGTAGTIKPDCQPWLAPA
ncbi:hypothetical protein D3C85_1787490 [compost metagenome]